MPRPPFPKTLRQFQTDFASEEACQRYLSACRWPEGFLCPRCGYRRAYELVNQRRRQCAGCRHQVSLTSGTVLHRTKIPLTQADRAIGNLQQWLIGTYHGVRRAQLQVYLDEFVLRHNRRKQPAAAFQTLLGLGTGRRSTEYLRIRGARDLTDSS